jgi:Secretion system C-terminal sorting domain
MAFIRNCVTTVVTVLCILLNTKAQTIYYPARSSQLLKLTAEDAAMLLQKAIAGSKFITQEYTIRPASGIILIYDSTITDNQACRVEGNGHNSIKFTAAEDNGLHFGIYQYLYQQLGFRFYQPGTIWETIPTLATAFKTTDTVYTCKYKYKTWFVSGGYNRWAMDNTASNDWSLYQRRNGMLGTTSFRGHRGDIMSGNYLTALQNNPCFVANFNGSRQATLQSVPDVNNTAAKELWANTIEQKYTQYKNNILNNPVLYTNLYRNFKYGNDNIGIEVPDAAKWGNSKDNEVCEAAGYPKESDQHFTLANFTAEKIAAKYPNKRFQLYAYAGHADVPSALIAINKNIDIQLIPTVYQLESSTNGLRNRWYSRTSSISEYHYLNLSNWSNETPSFKWSELKTTLQIAKDKKSQGVVWEASPAKFGSLPYLLAANSYLKDGIEVDSTLHEFCNNMFAGAGNTVYKILQMWGDEKTAPTKYNLQLYLQLLNTVVQQTQNAGNIVKERVRELKAYMHYMVLCFDLANDHQNKAITKAEKDAARCIYIAKTSKLQIINSYYMIATIVSKYAATSDFYAKYNVVNGTAYQNGSLPLITTVEIDNDFLQDLSKYSSRIEGFKLEEAAYIKDGFKQANIAPLAKINVNIGYTNGSSYYNKTAYHIIAAAAGSFTIEYKPRFDMPGKGYVNFVVEAADKTLQIVKDFSIYSNAPAGTLKIDLPQAGKYILTVVSKYKSAVDLSITTNGNYFYKNGQFLGNKTESYSSDLLSLPGFFYIPNGINKVYCNINYISSGKLATADALNKGIIIKDNNGNVVQLHLQSANDSSLFYLTIPEGAAGNFWQVITVSQFNLQFVNISNLLWYAQRKACSNANFTVAIVNKNGNCFTRLTTAAGTKNLNWEIADRGNITKYSNQATVDLPDYISPNALVTLTNGEGCSFSKKLNSDAKYLRAKEACASGAAFEINGTVQPALYPNPSTGVFNCMQNGAITAADEIVIYNTQGTQVGKFKNARQFNINDSAAGLYIYRMVINGEVFKGKVVKL